MGKRRNLKKEKAERNKAYANQYRKRQSRYSSRGRNFRDNSQKTSSSSESDQ